MIPAPLTLLETLFKIVNGNAVVGRQRFSLNFRNVSKTPPFWLKKWWLCPPLPARSRSLRLSFFQGMNQDLKGRRFADVAEVQRKSLAAHDSISVDDFKQCFQHGSGAEIAASSHRWSTLKVTIVSNSYDDFKYFF